MATPRVAAGALIVDSRKRVLLLRTTYKSTWDIPGGYVEPGESPRAACMREVTEEIGLTRPVGRLLAVDWAPSPGEGDKLLFVFDGGELTADDVHQIQLGADEIAGYDWFEPTRFPEVLNDRLVRRIGQAHGAMLHGNHRYLEHGDQVDAGEVGRC